jgi:hypothetical protein
MLQSRVVLISSLRYCLRRWATWLLWTIAQLTLGFSIAVLLIPALPAVQALVNLQRHRENAAVSNVEEEAVHDANSTVFSAFTSMGEVLGPILGAAAVGHFTQSPRAYVHTAAARALQQRLCLRSHCMRRYSSSCSSAGCCCSACAPWQRGGTAAATSGH